MVARPPFDALTRSPMIPAVPSRGLVDVVQRHRDVRELLERQDVREHVDRELDAPRPDDRDLRHARHCSIELSKQQVRYTLDASMLACAHEAPDPGSRRHRRRGRCVRATRGVASAEPVQPVSAVSADPACPNCPAPTPCPGCWQPPLDARWQYQLQAKPGVADDTGGIDVDICAAPAAGGDCVTPNVFDIDLYVDTKVSGAGNFVVDTAAVDAIHAAGGMRSATWTPATPRRTGPTTNASSTSTSTAADASSATRSVRSSPTSSS